METIAVNIGLRGGAKSGFTGGKSGMRGGVWGSLAKL
jgi:hypothetical protein